MLLLIGTQEHIPVIAASGGIAVEIAACAQLLHQRGNRFPFQPLHPRRYLQGEHLQNRQLAHRLYLQHGRALPHHRHGIRMAQLHHPGLHRLAHLLRRYHRHRKTHADSEGFRHGSIIPGEPHLRRGQSCRCFCCRCCLHQVRHHTTQGKNGKNTGQACFHVDERMGFYMFGRLSATDLFLNDSSGQIFLYSIIPLRLPQV